MLANRSLLLALLALVIVLGQSVASATPLGLTATKPDMNASTSITTDYNAGTDVFTVSGFLTQYTKPDLVSHNAGGTYSLTATIDGTGALVPGSGTLTIMGFVPDLGIDPPPVNLLTANLTQFGFSGSGASTVFEFVGDIGSGALAGDYTGHQVGIILNPGANCTFNGSFGSNFSGSTGTADNFNVPEPASIAFLLAGGLLMARRRRGAR